MNSRLFNQRANVMKVQPIVDAMRAELRTFTRERFMTRSFYPMLSGFVFADFDAEIVARAIALELQILRIYHKRFLRYVHRFFTKILKLTNPENRRFAGMELKIDGRLTNFRRQIRRSRSKLMRYGRCKRSNFAREGGRAAFYAFNRYGVISVQLSYENCPTFDLSWDDFRDRRPGRYFSLVEQLESFGQE